MRRLHLTLASSALLTVGGIAVGAAGMPLFPQPQDAAALPRFEVASVKPSAGPTGERGQPGGRYTATRTLRFFIADAFFFGTPLQIARVLGGPDWIDSTVYEINARAGTELRGSPDGPPRELFYGSAAKGDLTAEVQFPVEKA